jgi:hypothetical protein
MAPFQLRWTDIYGRSPVRAAKPWRGFQKRLRGRELLQVEAPQAVRKPVKLTLVHNEAESSPKHIANA